MGFFMSDPRDGYDYAAQYVDGVIEAARRTEKPLALVTNYSMTDERALALKLMEHGIPLLRGTRNALLAARHVMAWRDHRASDARPMPPALPDTGQWRARLMSGEKLSEYEGLRMLADFGIASPCMIEIGHADDLRGAAGRLRFPVVLKTAEDFAHKSDVGGVVLNLPDIDAVAAAYAGMSARLGPKALLAEMAPKGTELALGAIRDEGFGPVVLISAGGVLMEFLGDSVAALAPFDAAEAMALLRRLRVFRLLQGVRGQPPADLDALAEQIAAFSRMVAGLGDACAEIDINPLVCNSDGALALDCLIVPGRGC
jgi:acyl-CoA synthetase (NDP forming)